MTARNKTRREFIRDCVAGAAAVGAGPLLAKGMASAGRRRPNVLVFMTDQERFPLHLPPLNRPGLDRLKRSGVEFTHAVCSTPFCSPSRAGFWTGLYPHQAGVTDNVDTYRRPPSMDPSIPTMGHVLKAAGYDTAYFGKWHLTLQKDGKDLSRYGFDDYKIYSRLEQNGYRDDGKAAGDCAAWIRSRTANRPWFAVASIVNPHDINMNPLETPWRKYDEEMFARYADSITLPPSWQDDLAGKPSIQRNNPVRKMFGTLWGSRKMYGSEENWKRYISFYCSLIELADSHLTRVIEAVDAAGAWDDTVIIYTSDHGDMGGAHGLPIKGPYMYDELLRIPLVFSGARFTPGTRNQLLCNIDVAPTVADLAGARWPKPISGIGFSRMLDDPSAAGRGSVCLGSDFVFSLTSCIRTEKSKFAVYRPARKGRPVEYELYDLDKDPDEMTNLAGVAGYSGLQDDLQAALSEWEDRYGWSEFCRLKDSR